MTLYLDGRQKTPSYQDDRYGYRWDPVWEPDTLLSVIAKMREWKLQGYSDTAISAKIRALVGHRNDSHRSFKFKAKR